MTQNYKLSTLKIDQSVFIYNIVEEEGIQDRNCIITLMKIGNFIEMQDDNYEEVNLKVYQQLIGKLIYLLFKTQLDISFIIGQISKQKTNSQASYFIATKQVVQHLKCIMHLILVYQTYF